MTGDDERLVLVDASVFIRLTEVGTAAWLYGLNGEIVVPRAVGDELTDDPAASEVRRASDRGDVSIRDVSAWASDANRAQVIETAATRLGTDQDGVFGGDEPPRGGALVDGDVALLAAALLWEDVVVVTDDKPLREACKSLSIPVSGSLGVLVRAVERGERSPEDAKDTLYAMDEVGARLSASLVRRAERLIDAAAD